jgi:hypothetical protein
LETLRAILFAVFLRGIPTMTSKLDLEASRA